MELVASGINKRWLHSLVNTYTPECSEVRAAIAYAAADNLDLFEACKQHSKPVLFYGRYDHTVPVDPAVVKWFLDQKSASFTCRMVADILHSKVIWWHGVGAYVGSANLTNRAWVSNIEAGVFIRDEEMEQSSMIEDLRTFFDVIDARAHPIGDEFYKHLLELRRLGLAADKAAHEFQQRAPRFFPVGEGLASVDKGKAVDRAYNEFERRWRESLQVLRDISARVVLDKYRPSWIPANTPAGAQADQFVHAYYYKFIEGHKGGHLVDEAHAKHRLDIDAALEEALLWWKRCEFNFDQEKSSLLAWAPKLKEYFAHDRLQHLTKDEFVDAMSMVHAVRDYARKRSNVELGLPSTQQDSDLKIERHGAQLWDARTDANKSPLDVLQYVIWGAGHVERRIWAAARSPEWRLPWVQFSTLGEIVGWARPDEFPPRNDRTLKGLRALGYSVRSV